MLYLQIIAINFFDKLIILVAYPTMLYRYFCEEESTDLSTDRYATNIDSGAVIPLLPWGQHTFARTWLFVIVIVIDDDSSIFPVHRWRMVLGKISSEIPSSFIPIKQKMLPSLSISQPIISHIPTLGPFLADIALYKT